jgi:hypothetical protein
VHRQCLAGTVLAKNGEQFSVTDVERQVPDQRSAGNVDKEIVTREQGIRGSAHADSLSQADRQ